MKVRGAYSEKGFSILELMVAIAIGLMVLAGLVTIFVNNSRARNEIEKANRQTESGRYAMELITHDLHNAGYYAEFDPLVLPLPSTLPNPCDVTLAGLKAALPLHVQGYDNASTSPGTCSLTDLKNTNAADILVVRRATTCVAGTTGCDAPTGVPYFQASLCNSATELLMTDPVNYYALDFGFSSGSLNRHKRDCIASPPGTVADKHRYRTDIYFVANNNEGSDGVPTLKRAELGAGVFTIVPLVEGVENMQIEYGVDTTGIDPVTCADLANPTPDGVVDVYEVAPTCSVAANVTKKWQRVVAIKVHLLARNTEQTVGHTDGKTYTLGLKADGTPNTVGSPFNDAFKRHVYQSTVRLNNPAGRNATQ